MHIQPIFRNRIEESMKIRRSKMLKYIRIAVYIAIAIFLIILKNTDSAIWTCSINERFGILCPTCVMTRAIEAIFSFNFGLAVERNAYCTLVLFPIFAILFIDDILCMIFRKKSFVEIILGE